MLKTCCTSDVALDADMPKGIFPKLVGFIQCDRLEKNPKKKSIKREAPLKKKKKKS